MTLKRKRLGRTAFDLHALLYRRVTELARSGWTDEEIVSYSGHATIPDSVLVDVHRVVDVVPLQPLQLGLADIVFNVLEHRLQIPAVSRRERGPFVGLSVQCGQRGP